MEQGSIAKSIFDRAKLPNDVLIRIWNLADTEQRGKLSETEFIIAMHLLASFRSGAMRALPNNLPAGFYEAAARRGAPSRPGSGSRPVSEVSSISAIPRQFSGSGAPRTSSPLARQPYNAPNLPAQTTGAVSDWAIPPQDKAQYDAQFNRLDSNKQGFLGGEQAVAFFSNSRLSENDLAQIWDLSDITQTGQLNQDEFAVAMHLIRQQLSSREPLPASLPSNLIPPRMRQQVATPQASQAPSAAPPSKPKSAVEDLFGLDALTAPAPQVPQSTGGSSSAAAAPSAPSAPQSTSSPSPQQPSTHFKPFVPSSSFGQSLNTPQATGTAGTSQSSQQARAPADDDLLGDTDPEVNKRFTNETTDLANLSNQVNNLTNQMREVQNKQTTSKQELSQVANQKRDFESRLSQLRSAYEQEARELKSLQDRLTTAKGETAKLQQDLAMTQHSYQTLQEQKQQMLTGLEADQKENASLKERIAQVYKETNQIKPQIEKMRSEARQQKGLVAINKKQLSTAESEREKARAELSGATSEYNEATKELEDSKRNLEASHATLQNAVASPPPSTSSMNPFFRRTTSTISDRATTQSPFATQPVGSPNHSAFDSFFGSAMEDSRPFTPISDKQTAEAPKTPQPLSESKPSEELSQPQRKEEPPRFPSASQPPPPPPHSRQMTPSSLPLRESAQRAPSSTSSVGVIPPASQFGELSEASTPTKDRAAAAATATPRTESSPTQSQPEAEGVTAKEIHAPQTTTPHEPPSAPPDIPGAFPSDETPAETPVGPAQQEAFSSSPFGNGIKDPPQGREAATRNAFDTTFSGYEGKGKASINSSAFGGSKETDNSEFPPIQEFGDDDDDDSDSEEEKGHGFEDDFTPPAATGVRTEATPGPSGSEPPRPPLSRGVSSTSQLPTPGAQKSPPPYGEAVSSPSEEGAPRDANQFAAEYSGLLPSREDPTASPHLHSVESGPGSSGGIETIPTASVTAVDNTPGTRQQSQPPVPPKNAIDDFDSAFGDLSEAQTADDKGDEEFGSSAREGFDDFNPTFDSPAPSQAHSKAPTLDNSGFADFESNFSAPSQSISASAAGAPTRAGPTKDEWDAMFAGFGSGDASTSAAHQTNGDAATAGGAQKSDGFLDVFSVPESSTAASAQQKPPLNRAISATTEHDDPILKRLTGMGYSRDVSVAALEKFDYNLDKVGFPRLLSKVPF